MKLIIAGSRSLHDYKLIDKAITFANINTNDIDEIISGKASGIDSLAIKWAENHKISTKEFPADWKNLKVENCLVKENKYGKYNALAGYNRNRTMGQYADCLLAIWTQNSKGTQNMIDIMIELNKKYWVYEI